LIDIYIGIMKSSISPPKPRVPKPSRKLYCSVCSRAVQDTIHTSKTYYVDWYLLGGKVICKDCRHV